MPGTRTLGCLGLATEQETLVMDEGEPIAVPGWLRRAAADGWRLLVVAAAAFLLWLLFRQLKLIVVGIVLG
jgi:hypothetical protein